MSIQVQTCEIAGCGLVCSLGAGLETVFAGMCGGQTGFRPITRFPAAAYPQGMAAMLPEELEARLREEHPGRDLAWGAVLSAACEALGQGGQARPVAATPDPRLGLVLATNFGPMESLEWCWRERHDHGTIDHDTFAEFANFPAAVATACGCGGPLAQLSLSCASGAAAAALAKDWLDNDRADRVLAVGYDIITEYSWCGLTNLRTITTDKLRPFDSRRAGTIFGEGAAAMLLAKPGAAHGRPLGRLLGAATNNNAFHMTAPAARGAGSRRVMAAALAAAGIGVEAIAHVSAHATGTTANDSTETAALRDLFGPRLGEITVAAHKSQLGHMLGAAGLAEAVITLAAMRNGIIPPTVNHEQPDPECGLDCVPGQARHKQFNCAITNSAGIGGSNASLVLASI